MVGILGVVNTAGEPCPSSHTGPCTPPPAYVDNQRVVLSCPSATRNPNFGLTTPQQHLQPPSSGEVRALPQALSAVEDACAPRAASLAQPPAGGAASRYTAAYRQGAPPRPLPPRPEGRGTQEAGGKVPETAGGAGASGVRPILEAVVVAMESVWLPGMVVSVPVVGIVAMVAAVRVVVMPPRAAKHRGSGAKLDGRGGGQCEQPGGSPPSKASLQAAARAAALAAARHAAPSRRR